LADGLWGVEFGFGGADVAAEFGEAVPDGFAEGSGVFASEVVVGVVLELVEELGLPAEPVHSPTARAGSTGSGGGLAAGSMLGRVGDGVVGQPLDGAELEDAGDDGPADGVADLRAGSALPAPTSPSPAPAPLARTSCAPRRPAGGVRELAVDGNRVRPRAEPPRLGGRAARRVPDCGLLTAAPTAAKRRNAALPCHSRQQRHSLEPRESLSSLGRQWAYQSLR